MKIEYSTYAAGFCSHPERTTIKGGSLSGVDFPALCFALKHPDKGVVLFDTGFSSRFIKMCERFPDRLYNLLLPVKMEAKDDLCRQLKTYQDIDPEDVKTIFLSHFHIDHIAGALDFPDAHFICSREAYDAVKDLGPISSVIHAFSMKLLPHDFAGRCSFIEDMNPVDLTDQLTHFNVGYDLLGDGSVVATALPGHAIGQYGIVFKDQKDDTIFLCADACWSSKAYKENKLPHFITRLIHYDWKAYKDTLLRLHGLHKNRPNIKIIPSHCREVSYEGKQ